MTDLSQPLTDAELDRLDRFLLDRIDEEADTEGRDVGVLDVSDLDGMLTAIVSAPVTVPPSRWLPAVWGDFEPVWEEMTDFQEIFSLLIRHMNSIADLLMQQPEDFEPLFHERVVHERRYLIVDEWCEGYWRGVRLAEPQWIDGDEEVARLLAPILGFTAQTNWAAHEYEQAETERLQQTIAASARLLHEFWLARRPAPDTAGSQPVRRSEPKVGRNEPCPCGSGRKYKQCCLQ
jgi:uncharacterized protein